MSPYTCIHIISLRVTTLKSCFFQSIIPKADPCGWRWQQRTWCGWGFLCASCGKYHQTWDLPLHPVVANEDLPSLKLTAKAPENGCLEDKPFLLGWPIFRGELLVSGRVGWDSLLKMLHNPGGDDCILGGQPKSNPLHIYPKKWLPLEACLSKNISTLQKMSGIENHQT